jgi:hypothetical protein
MDFTYVLPSDLRHCWWWVRMGLEKVRSKGHSEWLAEDIYCDCYEQRSMLWTLPDHKGFIVLQPNGDAMHIWAAWLDSNKPDDLAFGLEFAKGIAKQSNCKKVTFSSMRSGWEIRAKQLGFRPRNWELSI